MKAMSQRQVQQKGFIEIENKNTLVSYISSFIYNVDGKLDNDIGQKMMAFLLNFWLSTTCTGKSVNSHEFLACWKDCWIGTNQYGDNTPEAQMEGKNRGSGANICIKCWDWTFHVLEWSPWCPRRGLTDHFHSANRITHGRLPLLFSLVEFFP